MSDKPLFTYNYYEPGKVYGVTEFTVDETVVAKWRSVYPGDNDPGVMPAGMLAMIIVGAVLTCNAPRPPGGVHGGQSFDVRRMPRIGETLLTEVKCLDKEIKKERKWVRALTTTRSKDTGEIVLTGIMTTLVAQ
ncbi:MAG: MaoC family dehydratase [Betaproteobacteria bacterium]|nr:MaoC family dehydratase [Betaproteobacteria bacterium]